jgi:hypothetical protein
MSIQQTHNNLPYRLFGNLYLEDPVEHLDCVTLTRLKELEPHFQLLESDTEWQNGTLWFSKLLFSLAL